MEHKLIKVDEADPTRCQAIDGEQCRFQAMEGAKYCPKHGGQSVLKNQEKAELRKYRLTKWRERHAEFSMSEQALNLREEIGILQVMLEEIWNQCHSTTDLMLYANKIRELVMNIKDVVVACGRLDSKQGNLLDKSQALILAGQIVEIIGNEINDNEAIDRINNGIIDIIAKLAGKELPE